jgi:hypothetical protein
MLDPNFDPLAALQQLNLNQQQLDNNQQQIILAMNTWQKTLQDHEKRLDLNQETINQMLNSMQNQYKLLVAMLDQVNAVSAVNNAKGNVIHDETSNSNKSQ